MRRLANATVGLVVRLQTLPSKFAEREKWELSSVGFRPSVGIFLTFQGPDTVHKYLPHLLAGESQDQNPRKRSVG